jgi:hypothetical protein
MSLVTTSFLAADHQKISCSGGVDRDCSSFGSQIVVEQK